MQIQNSQSSLACLYILTFPRAKLSLASISISHSSCYFFICSFYLLLSTQICNCPIIPIIRSRNMSAATHLHASLSLPLIIFAPIVRIQRCVSSLLTVWSVRWSMPQSRRRRSLWSRSPTQKRSAKVGECLRHVCGLFLEAVTTSLKFSNVLLQIRITVFVSYKIHIQQFLGGSVSKNSIVFIQKSKRSCMLSETPLTDWRIR